MKIFKNIFLGVLMLLIVTAVVLWYGWLIMLACGVAYHAGVVGGTLNLVQSSIIWILLAAAWGFTQLPPKRK